MKGFQLGLKPQYTYQEFLATGAGKFKNLPKSWKVRVQTLAKDLIEKPEDGIATIMTDEFSSVNDKTGQAGATTSRSCSTTIQPHITLVRSAALLLERSVSARPVAEDSTTWAESAFQPRDEMPTPSPGLKGEPNRTQLALSI